MRLVVGLGNVGQQYINTRHNVGFMVVDSIRLSYGLTQWCLSSQFHAEIAQAVINLQKFLLAKPVTYMNLSGNAVQAMCAYHRLSPEDIIVIHDDIDLELGVIRLKKAGGSGGHNGLKSITQQIGANYYRIRVGIARPPATSDVTKHVLGRFSETESILITQIIQLLLDNFYLLLIGNFAEFEQKICK